ncbi:MAG: FAD-dependent oxidoreductase [Bacteroides sp.]|nr:FAD-dependent oxidoreductase [Eubacterium sp.]MCM1419724.1 FAD-dependent oxidoreductase [Roseburia sp.]MCM1463727.1 FAD-dependent oxidoreductase [Bacteroides sp.]
MYDTVIIGSGPAGLSAAVYASRARLSAVVAEKTPFGAGQISEGGRVENYPGLYGESGFELGERLRFHAKALGAYFSEGEVVEVKKEGGVFLSVFSDGSVLESRTVVYAAGASHKKLGIAGEARLTGRGVSYCATCDGAFYRDKTVAVVGGGDTALGEALFLEKLAKTVYLVHRRARFRASRALQERVRLSDKIRLVTEAIPLEILGGETAEGLRLSVRGREKIIAADGVFIAIGMSPNTAAVSRLVPLDEGGAVVADETGTTAEAGFFAAGDVRTKRLRQVVTAAADGANCIASVSEYLEHTPTPVGS